jgi:hypothetical protein
VRDQKQKQNGPLKKSKIKLKNIRLCLAKQEKFSKKNCQKLVRVCLPNTP